MIGKDATFRIVCIARMPKRREQAGAVMHVPELIRIHLLCAATSCDDGVNTNQATCLTIGEQLGTGCRYVASGTRNTCTPGE